MAFTYLFPPDLREIANYVRSEVEGGERWRYRRTSISGTTFSGKNF
jgi:hypothetical protein